MKADFSAVVVAAGESQRFRSQLPNSSGFNSKSLIRWEAKALFVHTIEALSSVLEFKELCLVVRDGDEKTFLDEIQKSSLVSRPIRIIKGGARRQDSVRLGIESLKPVNRIVIHDGARPFLDQNFLSSLFDQAANVPALIPTLSIKETLKEVAEDGSVISTHDRRKFFRVQTPQVFDSNLIRKVHLELKDSPIEFTDDAMMLEYLGHRVMTHPGDAQNIKVTVPSDLDNRIGKVWKNVG
ncbi:MAG: 2-C-methyl-D-erythritol 4-phosphate cytidylyltransferase [Deltaproteobacteria bacterium CG11_big_fil_rev_8_21_14_0_20_45_16]|nr:MAG: 2-C-methyl-D-erythritol 4-phosphate cytidylyltransferase [Deltaproteobacteria bacterium CG11_big_fil_rev_8_21_14_0_20_45_16]